MDDINGTPLLWDAQEDNALLGSLFPGENTNAAGQLQDTASYAGYESRSRDIWQQMRTGTSYDVSTDCGMPFTADFYNGGIHFENLVAFLKRAVTNKNELFNYCDYEKESDLQALLGNQAIFPQFSPTGENWSPFPKLAPNTGFKYKNSTGKTVTASLSGRLNRRVCYLEGYGCSVRIDAVNNIFTGKVRFYYAGTKQFRADAADTAEKDDFRIEDMYIAVELAADTINNFLYLVREIGGDEDFRFYKGYVAKKYADKIRGTNNSRQLKLFYESLPEAIMDSFSNYLPYEVMYNHILLLTDYDDTGLFSGWVDSSSSLINLLRATNNVSQFYFDLCNDPKLVNRIYGNLDGASVIDGIAMSNKTAFANILTAFCQMHKFDGAKKPGTKFHYGAGYEFNANVAFTDNTEEKDSTIYLEQQKIEPIVIPSSLIGNPMGTPIILKDTEPVHSGYYGPLDMVFLIAADSNLTIPVPAIYIKSLSDEAEWQDIKHNIRIGTDILMLILAVATLGTTSPLLLAAAYTDIALSVGDMAVAAFEEELKKTADGQEFLAAWEQVMIAGGIATAGPLLVNKIFTTGTKVLRLAKEGQLINAMRDCLAQLVQKSKNIGIFVKGQAEIVFDFAKELGGQIAPKLKALQDLGVVLLKGQLKFAKYEGKGYVLLYKDEVIAQGTVKDLLREVGEITKAGKSDVLKYLDDLADIAIFIKRISLQLKTLPDEAFFWSGKTNGIGGQDIALEIAKSMQGTTLEGLLEANKISMPMWDPFNEKVKKIWSLVSKVYAEQVSGNIRAVIGQNLRLGNIWEKFELPALKANQNVKSITIIDPETKIEKLIFKR